MARTGSESGSIATSQSRAALILNEIGYVASLPVGHYPTNGHRAVTGQHWLDEEDTADNSKDNSKCLIRWWCSSPVEETSLPHGHCHRGRDSTLVVHPRENGPSPRICSLLQAMSGRRFDPQTRNRTGQSLQSIPHATPAAVLLQMVAFGQVAEVLFQGVPAGSGQLDRLSHRDAPMLPGELHDLQ